MKSMCQDNCKFWSWHILVEAKRGSKPVEIVDECALLHCWVGKVTAKTEPCPDFSPREE